MNNFSRSLTKDSSSTRRKTSSKSKVKGQSENRHKKQLSSESELGSIKKQRGRSPRKSRDKSESESKYQSSICPVLKDSECNKISIEDDVIKNQSRFMKDPSLSEIYSKKNGSSPAHP